MDLVNDLGNDLALAALINKTNREKIDSKEILPLINKIREVLEPISAKDHSTSAFSADVDDDASAVVFSPIANEATKSH